ncbi:LINE-1 reverse transcriptase -like protein [Triplophysa tibetana]|uniref:LINE-1 reverse transcriptase-like protein n=1 Tax=Triplophysa tibetana TaxID=1572043 RepID=A0A5A9MX91_9TELE|nr:LINE-1 reverse transcriptase -like protein [Triplophysa tibetana]
MQQSRMSRQSGTGLKLVSWNCNGLNQPIKRSKVLHHLQQLGAHIVFLQETHLNSSSHIRLKGRWVSQVFNSSFNGKSRGVAILIHKSVPFVCSNVIADPNGRFVFVTGQLYSNSVILANVYGPNWDDDNFFQQLFAKLPDMSTHLLIMGGDFNCWLNPVLDRSSTRPRVPSKSSKTILSFMDEFSVSDPWRFLNPSGKMYSFFSHVHHSFSRIDYFLLDNLFLHSVQSCSYEAILISDHAPTTLELFIQERGRTCPPWRLNTRLLSNEDFVKFVSNQIDFFLTTNRTPGISASLLWETMKAYIRGEIISYSSYENKQRKKQLKELRVRISQLDDIYASSPSPNIYKDRLSLQAEFDVLSTKEVEELLFKAKYCYYESGDKATKLLAHQLRQASSSQQISQMNTPSGVTTDPNTINDQFKRFYCSLYTSEVGSDLSALDSFFDSLELVKVDANIAEQLEGPITIDELKRATFSMQSGKCPGPDGFPTEFYKTFCDRLAPVLIEMFNESLTLSKLPQTLNQASISLLLKKNKDPLSCSSYRPISLLSVDVKLLSKLLALRLESVLPLIISPDQTGFVQNRHGFFNLRRLLNVVYNPSTSMGPEAVISLDAEKAFDRVEWNYLFYALERFGFGQEFISWIKLLYSSPVASVRTNDTQSDYFPLHRSTRQGCPLSPLLFAVAIEPLAIALRSEPRIIGITRFGLEQKVSLYADDLLLYVSNLSVSVPAALDILSSFGQISGYKLNLDKSELFPLNQGAQNAALGFPFKIVPFGFKYLGIQIRDRFEDLFDYNFAPLLDQIRIDFQRWSLLPLSLVARVNSVKMNILPKLSYLFQSIPVCLPQSFFHKLDKSITEFIWNGKVPRLRKELLQRPRTLGGLALPNLRFYYWASILRVIQLWISLEGLPVSPAWLKMEMFSVKPASLTALTHAPLNFSPSPFCNNILVKSTFKIWKQIRRYFGLQTFSFLAPLPANPVFHPSLIDGAFSLWSDCGIKAFRDLYISGTFASFQQLSDKFHLPRQHFFRYLQVRSFIRNLSPNFPSLPEASLIDSFLTPLPTIKGAISRLYNLIYSLQLTPQHKIKFQWEEDLGEEISEELWDAILRRVHSSSICARHGLTQCKIIHRAHLTRVRLSKIYKDVDPMCIRCHQAPATHAHMFWSCPSLFNFWTQIFNSISVCIGVQFDPTACTALFGVLPPTLQLPKYKADFVAFISLLARRLILLRWKSPAPPSHSSWIRDILQFVKLEKVRCSIHGSLAKFNKTWDPFFAHVEGLIFTAIPE